MEEMKGDGIISKINGVSIPRDMYISTSPNKKIVVHACHSSFNYSKSFTLRQYFCLNEVPMDLEEIIAWVELMNDCGFKCDLVFEDRKWDGNPPYQPEKKFDFYIEYSGSNYISIAHWRVGFTAIRMLNYSRMQGLSGVPKKALSLYKTEGYEDAYFALTSAFKGMHTTEYGGDHNLIDHNKIRNFTPITRKELEERCECSSDGPNSVSVK